MQPMQPMQVMVDPTAVMGRRVGSFLIDWLILIGLSVLLFFMTADFVQYDEATAPSFVRAACYSEFGQSTGNHFCFTTGDTIWYSDGSNAGTAQMLGWVYSIAVFLVWQGLAGKTPGKVVMGVRTVRADGQPPGILKAFLRHLLWIVDLFPYCIPGLVGYIVANGGQGHQRVGDKVAQTYVVKKEYAGQPVMAAAAQTGWATPAAGAPMPGMPAAPPPAGVPQAPVAGAPSAASSSQAPAADPSQPQWDPARNAYIAWDATAQRWQQFDDASQEWRPI